MFSITVVNAALNDFVELKITNASDTDFCTYCKPDVGSIVMLSAEKRPDSSKISILMLQSDDLHFYIPDEIAADVYEAIIHVTAWKNEVTFSRLYEFEKNNENC